MTKDEEFESQPENKKNGCPYISVLIYGREYELLVDSGAEISAISTKYEDKITSNNQVIPTLPLSGMVIHNATGDKATRVNSQLLIPMSINNKIIQIPFIAVPTLNEGGILGNDFLETYHAKIDFGKKTITIKINQEEIVIPFVNKTNGAPMHLKSIQTQVPREPINTKEISNYSQSEQNYLDKILKQFSEVFKN